MIETLFAGQAKTGFLEKYYLKLPFAQAGGCADWAKRDGWQIIERLLESPDADVMVVKNGERWAENRLPTFPEARELFAQGYTLLVRHAERHDEELKSLARSFREEFRAAVDVHLYATPGEAFGFGWHYDVEDVFILQIAGTKEYSLRKNTVNPWPVLDNMPRDLRYEREIMPMLKCSLQAGDWLYIPHGYWHMAEAKRDSISLAVGLMNPTALDVLDFARRRLLESIRWRQRLPISSEDSEQSLEQRFAELGEELKTLFSDPMFARQFQNARRPEDDE